MRGNRSYAWVVAVANDDLVSSAIISGETLRKTGSCGAVLALVSNAISKSYIARLESTFDLVIVKDVEFLATKLNNNVSKGVPSEMDSLLISALNMTTFSKLAVIRPGVMVLQQSDKLFDSDNVAMLDKNGSSWQTAVMSPDKKTYTRILEQLENDQSSANVLNLVFSGKWKSFTDKWIVGAEDKLNGKVTILESLMNQSPIKDAKDTSDWIAIVGMSCRFPDANNKEEYWDLLESGRNTCTSPPKNRTNLMDMDPTSKGNFLKCPVDQFDAAFFGISPSEATFTDPQARLLLEVSWEAFEDAAMNPDVLKGTQTGVFYGSWLQEYRDAMNRDGSPATEDFIRKYLGNSFGCSAAKLSFFYGFNGPNVATESGCSSSMVAVDLAVKSLQKRECPVAVVAGANILLFMDMKQKVLWAEDGKSKTFDADANGYARSEGIAVLILKRFSDAMKDGDRVHAVIRGSGVSQEGLSKSFGTPTVDSECAAMKGALKMAKVEPWEVDYVEAHATGTTVGDPIEAQAIVKAYSGDRKGKPLYIGSGKTNLGHSEACSGMAGIFKVVLAMKNQLIPAHLNLNSINPQVNFESISGKIPLEKLSWPKDNAGKPRIAGVSSFGITGTDVHVILQEAPEESTSFSRKTEIVTRPLHLMTISAKSEGALEEFSRLYENFLEDSNETMEDISYTANACRPHHPFRMAILGGSKLDLRNNLIGGSYSQGRTNGSPKICFTFPGRIGLMNLEPARILYRTSPVFKNHVDECDKLFQATSGRTLIPLLTNVDEDTVAKGVTWYALIPVIQFALVKLWASWGIEPDCVMGHCIGEISAAVVSGALPIEEVFKLVKCIDHLLQVGKEQPALMMAIQASVEKVKELISSFLENNGSATSWIDVSSVNAFNQTVVAGDVESLGKFKEFLTSQEYRCKLLVMDFCAHSRAVEPACQKSLETFESVTHQKVKIPYVSSVTGKVVEDEEMCGKYWYNVFRGRVNFTDSCHTTSSQGLADVYIEMGLEGALSRVTQENLAALEGSGGKPGACIPSLWSVKGDKCWVGLLSSLGQLYTLGGNVNWDGFYGNQGDRCHKRVELPQYPFQRKSFWYQRRKNLWESGNQQEFVVGKRIHSLLGGAVETCVEDPQVFQNWMLEDGEAKYIYDHVIGTEVIFPGAGFLEMILAAANHHHNPGNGGNRWIHVEGFSINSPLHLEGDTPKRMQCLVDGQSKTGRVYAWNGQESEEAKGLPWKLYASGNYMVEEVDETVVEENIENIEEIKSRCAERESGTDNFYLAARQVGLNFGQDFRSMKGLFQGESGTETLIEVDIPQTEGEGPMGYICHPILIDAMIQGLMLHTKPGLKKLHVPVAVGKFSVRQGAQYQSQSSSTWYVYCKTEQDSGLTKQVLLLNQAGTVLATMVNAELVMTSVDSVLKAAGCHETKNKADGDATASEFVDLHQFDIVWKRIESHQSRNSMELKCCEEDDMNQLLDSAQNMLENKNAFSEEETKLDRDMNRLCCLYVVKALYEMGWVPSDGLENLGDIQTAAKWGVVPGLVPAYKHFVSFVASDGLLETAQSYPQLLRELEETLARLVDYPALKTVQACGSQLAGILQGTVNPHYILFGGNVDDPTCSNLAEYFYKYTRFTKVSDSLRIVFTMIKEQVQTNKRAATDTVRILEVGAGTGAFARGIVEQFGDGVKYEYTFTDISPSFLVKAKEIFAGKPFCFKTFNIEMDPLKQGFCPEYFDIVIGMDVVHATRNVKESLNNLHMVTKPGGWIMLAETEKPVLELDICFGILEGYWLYEDGIRSDHCTLDGGKWLELLNNIGFTKGQGKFLSCNSQMCVIFAQKENVEHVCEIPDSDVRGNWTVFFHEDQEAECTAAIEVLRREMKAVKRTITPVALDKGKGFKDEIERCLDDNQNSGLEGFIYWIGASGCMDAPPDSQQILEPLLHAGKYLIHKKWKVLPRFHIVTEGCQNTVAEAETGRNSYVSPDVALSWGFMRNMRIEQPGLVSKSIDLEKGADVQAKSLHLVNELWLDDKETEVAFRGGSRYVRRAIPKNLLLPEKGTIEVPENQKYFTTELPKSKVISDVKFVAMEDPSLELGADDILVEVKSVSLNFKDVLAVMKPSADFENLTSIGLDFSGVVVKTGKGVTKWTVGQPVFGCGWEQGAMKSHVVTKADAVVAVPDSMTFNEATTLPAVWLTAWYCMVEVAKLRKGQTILIHAASGGVGLIAIQIAKLLGVHVIGTAGTEKKRNFVKSQGVEHVFNSRTVEFGQRIQEITEGRGVDMILNCLTGPGFKEASLQVCKDGGNFVEISKLDIWTPAQVMERRPGVKYTIVDVTEVDKPILGDIMNKLTEFLASGAIKPLPYTQYSASEIKNALAYLQKAKQIGKVIVTMPQYREDICSYQREYLFNDRSTYLITGGKGAIGMAVAKWMLTEGAKNLVLAGRSPASDALKEEIRQMESDHNAVVCCKELDITDLGQCKNMLEELDQSQMPPLRGIHHCAGLLSDKLLSHHDSWSNYEQVIPPKVQGAWNIHQLTKDRPMEFFVLYSSAAGTFGNLGQSNYAAANCYLDSLAEVRVAMGLPALSINWGQWSLGLAKDFSIDWLHPFNADEGVAALVKLMKTKPPPTIVAGLFDFYGLFRMTPYYKDTFIDASDLDSVCFFGRGAKNSGPSMKKQGGANKKVLLIEEYQGLGDEDQKNQLVRNFVINMLCETLGTKPDEIKDDDQHFSDMGMDSLMSIEFANKVNSEMEGGPGGGGGFIDLEECGTVTKMTAWISETLAKLTP